MITVQNIKTKIPVLTQLLNVTKPERRGISSRRLTGWILKIDVQTGTIIAVLTTATQHKQCFWPVIQQKRLML